MPTTAHKYETLADVLHALGDVPPSRILWNPPPGTATEADLLRCRDRVVELVDGILVEKVASGRKSYASAALIFHLGSFVRSHRLGVLAGARGWMRLSSRVVRSPEVSFTAWQGLTARDAHLQPIADFAPDLAVEFFTDGNTRREMARKRREYFRRGTKLVWIIDPVARTVAVYTDPRTHTVLTDADTLTGGAVLRGFALPLVDFFNDPQLVPPNSP